MSELIIILKYFWVRGKKNFLGKYIPVNVGYFHRSPALTALLYRNRPPYGKKA
jgi:hypothetical protein